MTETSTKFVLVSEDFPLDHGVCDTLEGAKWTQEIMRKNRPESTFEIQVETTTKITKSLAEWEAAQKSNAKAHPFH